MADNGFNQRFLTYIASSHEMLCKLKFTFIASFLKTPLNDTLDIDKSNFTRKLFKITIVSLLHGKSFSVLLGVRIKTGQQNL